MRDRIARIARRVAALLFGLVLALVLLEGALRLTGAFPARRNPLRGFCRTHPTLGWVGVPDYVAWFRQGDFRVLVDQGPGGFRVPGHGVEAFEPQAPRVAVLGDSFTWGWGVAKGDTFCDRLQERLGPAVEVRNFGVNAYGTGQQRWLLEERVLAWEPDVVVAAFFENDLYDNVDGKDGRRPAFALEGERLVALNHPVTRGISGLAQEISRASLAISFVHYNVDVAAGRLNGWRRARRNRAAAAAPEPPEVRQERVREDERRWRVYRALLEEMRAVCARAPSAPELRVLYVPTWNQVMSADAPGAGRRVGELCAELGIAFLDPAPGLRAARAARPDAGPRATPLYFAHDDHWSPLGHAEVARILAESWSWGAD